MAISAFLPACSVSLGDFIFSDILQLFGTATLDILFSYSENFKFRGVMIKLIEEGTALVTKKKIFGRKERATKKASET